MGSEHPRVTSVHPPCLGTRGQHGHPTGTGVTWHLQGHPGDLFPLLFTSGISNITKVWRCWSKSRAGIVQPGEEEKPLGHFKPFPRPEEASRRAGKGLGIKAWSARTRGWVQSQIRVTLDQLLQEEQFHNEDG